MLNIRDHGRLTDNVTYTYTPDDVDNPFRFYDLTRDEDNIHLGTTNFFRHPTFFKWLAARVNQWNGHTAPRILAAPCCVGTETYSLAAEFKKSGCFDRFPHMTVTGFDISAEFTRVARRGVYPVAMAAHIPPLYRDDFEICNNHVRVTDDLKKHVRILSSRDMTKDFRLQPYDIVITSNLLMHLKNDAAKADMVDNLCRVSRSLLCLNNLNQDARRNVLLLQRRLHHHGFSELSSQRYESLTIFTRHTQKKPYYA